MITKSIAFTPTVVKELETVVKYYGENQSRVINRLITEAFIKLTLGEKNV